jgi:hypothetical protein
MHDLPCLVQFCVQALTTKLFLLLQESDHHGESGEGEVSAHVAQEIRGCVPEILPPRRRGQAIQFQLLGLSAGTPYERISDQLARTIKFNFWKVIDQLDLQCYS